MIYLVAKKAQFLFGAVYLMQLAKKSLTVLRLLKENGVCWRKTICQQTQLVLVSTNGSNLLKLLNHSIQICSSNCETTESKSKWKSFEL